MNITEPLTKMAHAQRVALAGSLLESQTRDRQFEPLLLLDRDAFRPYAELVLGSVPDNCG